MRAPVTQALAERVAFLVSPEGMLLMDKAGTILLANPAMAQLVGQPVGELVGRKVLDFLPQAVQARHLKLFEQQVLQPDAGRMESVKDVQLTRADGSSVAVDISLVLWQESGRANAVAFIRDISDFKHQVDNLRHRATHDELTDLPNRWLFRQHLDQALARSARDGHRVAVMYLDLDDFKRINDTLGHAIGDALLTQVARRLSSIVRESDTLARLGGDEFAILLSDIVSAKDITGVASKLLDSFAAPYEVGVQAVSTAGSLGIAVYPDDARDADTLLDCADTAMYEAKRMGRGNYARYSSRSLDARCEDVPGLA